MTESVSHVNVQVAVRCRPLNNREKARGNLHVVTTDPNHNRVRVAHKKVDRTYQYDHVFGPFASQEEVFTNTVEPIVREMLQGFSTTVFAYGQTGTGKTHTMEGDISSSENMGVIPRSVHAIFDYLEGIRADYTVRTSFLELYNEELQDLLADCTQKSKVVLREDSKRGVVCCGLEEVQVVSAKDIFSILEKGIQQRKTAETLMNKNSSRSHSIFTLKIMIKEWMPDGQEVVRNGQLNLVDLAGSECVGRSGAKNVRAREAGNINQSLLTLGRVITALVEHHPHVPYRDSKLTRLLQESLGGKAKTCIIATVTSSSDALDETLSSLDYALKAKNIENKPVANHKLSKTHLLKEYAGEVDSLRSMLQASRERNGIYVEPWRFELMENTIASQSNQIAEMENIVASKNNEAKELKTERDSYKLKSEELEGALEASKGREEATSARLTETLERLELTEKDLVASRAMVDDQRKQIAATQEALKLTEEELGATKTVVEEQAATERALTAEAEQTKSSLVSAERDVEGLNAKVARQEDEAADKRANALAFGDSATAATAEVSGAVALFAGKHSEGCERLLESVASAETAAKAAAEGLADATAHALAEVDRRCKDISKGVVDGSKSVDNLVEVAATAFEEAVMEQKDTISAWQKEVEASLGALRQGLEIHEQDVSELSEDVRGRAQEAEREMSGFRDACVAELTEVRAWADERIAAQTKQMESQSEEAMAVAARSKEETKAEVASLMQSFSALMSGLQRNASERADRQASAAGEAWSRSILAARSLGPEISEKMGGVAGSFERRSKSVEQKMASSSSVTQNALQEQRKAAVAFASSVGEVSKETSVGAGRSSSATDAASSSLKENLAMVSARVIAMGNVCARDVEVVCKGTGEAAERVAGLSLKAEGESAEQAHEVEKKVESLASAVEELETTHTSSLNRCVSTIEDHVEEACRFQPPSNGTPDKKRYPRPDLFSTTRPIEDIMVEFRKGEVMLQPPQKCAVASGEGVSHDVSAVTHQVEGISSASSVGSKELGMEEVETSSVSMFSVPEDPISGGGEVEGKDERKSDGVAIAGVELEIPPLSGSSVAAGGESEVGTGTASPPLGEATNTSVLRATKTKIPGMRRSTRRARAK